MKKEELENYIQEVFKLLEKKYLESEIYDIVIIPFPAVDIMTENVNTTFNIFVTCWNLRSKIERIIRENEKSENLVFQFLDISERRMLQEEWLPTLESSELKYKYVDLYSHEL